MRLVTFTDSARGVLGQRIGVLHENDVVDLYAAEFSKARRNGDDVEASRLIAARRAPADMVAFFDSGEDGRRRADLAVGNAVIADEVGDDNAGPFGEAAVRPATSVRLCAPVPRPRRIRDYLCYSDHLTGAGLTVPPAFAAFPICYKCNVETVVGPEETLRWPVYSEQLDFELELGVFVSRPGRDIAVEDATKHIGGVTIFNDVSARDIQLYEMSLNIGTSKGKDFCTAMGPCVATLDELDPDDIKVTARINGETWVTSSNATARYSFAEVLAWASYGEPVYSGEFLATGTVGGGCGLELDRWIAPGDVVELEAEGIGVLSNPVGQRETAPPGAGLTSYVSAPRAGTHS